MQLKTLMIFAAFLMLAIQIMLMLIAGKRNNPKAYDLPIFVVGAITVLLFATAIGLT